VKSRRRVNSTVGHPLLETKPEMKIHLFCLILLVVIAASVNVSAQTTDGPTVVAAVAPIYPAIAAAAHASGDVNVDVKIDTTGRVASAHAVDGHALLKAVCEATARRWKFVPATEQKTERTARLTFTFREVDDHAAEIDRTPVFFPPYKVEITGPKIVIQKYSVH
jgi:TonB family protein